MNVRGFGVSLVFLAVLAFGQGDRGSITGVISDPAGAVVVNAPVEARNVETGAISLGVSTATGNYVIPQLPAGSYEVTISVPGFKKLVRQGLTLQVQQTLRVDVSLEVGATTDSVTINEAAPLLKTESGEISHNVSSDRVAELPVGSLGAVRTPLTVAQLLPGANFVSAQTIRVNGTPANAGQVRIDGLDATYSLGMSNYAFTQPSVDAIQEVAVQTSNFAAEYGLAGGAVFNFTMRSGTNQFHGSVYDYVVNEAFHARQPFLRNRARQRTHDFGFTVGGPITIPKVYNGKDRTFFFGSWETRPTNNSNNTTFTTVPTDAFRSGDFSAAMTSVGSRNLGNDPLGRAIIQNAIYDPATQRAAPNGSIVRDAFPGNLIPAARMDPVALAVQRLVPRANLSGLVNNGNFPFRTISEQYIPSFKIDHTLSARHKLSFFWSWTHQATPIGSGSASSEGFPQPISTANPNYFDTHQERLNYDFTLTPSMLLHLGAAYQNSVLDMPAHTQNYDAARELGLRGPFIPYSFPNFQGMSNAQGGLQNLGSVFNGAQKTLGQKTTATASLNVIRNSHSYKFGSEVRIEGFPNYNLQDTQGLYIFSPAETGLPYLNNTQVPGTGAGPGLPYASFLLGLVNNGNMRRPAEARLGKQQWGFFAQDTWKVTRKFTLDYGLRYDYATYQREQYGRHANFSATTPNPSAGGRLGAVIYEATCNCKFAKNYPWGVGPRLGFAYQIDQKTVVRGGAGVIYNGTANNNVTTRQVTSSNPFSSPVFGEPAMTLRTGVPLTESQIAWPNFDAGYYPIPRTLTGPPVAIDQNAGRPSRTYQWSIGIQREFKRNLVAEVSYVGNRGIWWPAAVMQNYNAVTPQILSNYGLSLDSAADRALLTQPLNSANAIARGFRAPYSGFQMGSPLAQALRPFPQFSSGLAPLWAPLGTTWYDSLQAKVTQRFSNGLDFTYNFTYATELTAGTESDSVGPFGVAGVVNDVFNRQQNKYLSFYSRPLVSNFAANYTVPQWGSNKILRQVLSGWQVGTLLTYASGQPIPVPAAQNNLNNQLLRGTTALSYANRVPGEPLYTVDINCHCYDPSRVFVLNPRAWADPAPGQWGTSTAYYNDFRKQRRPQENFNFGRSFRFTESINFSIRAEFTNIFNRTRLPDPLSANAGATQTRNAAGATTAGFGWLNLTTAATPRQGQIVARFRF